MQKVQCLCGQENQLVETKDGLCYDITRHGNGELCKGLCFNCRAPLKGLSPIPAANQTKTEPELKPVEKPVGAFLNVSGVFAKAGEEIVDGLVKKPQRKKKKK